MIDRDILCDLELWTIRHKKRAVTIEIDNGYGATCWSINLRNEIRTIIASEVSFFDLERAQRDMAYPEGYLGKNNSLVVIAYSDDEWEPGIPGRLSKVVELALATANKIGAS